VAAASFLLAPPPSFPTPDIILQPLQPSRMGL
jgi:hypothetical protein